MVSGNKRAIPALTRRLVAVKHGMDPEQEHATVRCYWCGEPGIAYWPRVRDGRPGGWVAFTLELDHVIPESLGGDGSPENIVLACRRCNRRKQATIWTEPWSG